MWIWLECQRSLQIFEVRKCNKIFCSVSSVTIWSHHIHNWSLINGISKSLSVTLLSVRCGFSGTLAQNINTNGSCCNQGSYCGSFVQYNKLLAMGCGCLIFGNRMVLRTFLGMIIRNHFDGRLLFYSIIFYSKYVDRKAQTHPKWWNWH